MSEIIDFKLAIEKAGGNIELAKDLFKMLLAELPEQLESLKQAVSTNNHESAWDIAHKLHGSAAYCGLPELQAAAKSTEDAIKAKDESSIGDDYHHLEQIITRLINSGPQILNGVWQA